MTRSTDRRTKSPFRGGLTPVLFRAAAGPRQGFGHLVRCTSLANAMCVPAQISVRGGEAAHHAARAMGCELVSGGPKTAIASSNCQVLVVDDPVVSDAQPWIHAARRAGRPVASVHDLGIGCLDSDLVIDGSVVRAPSLRTCAAELLQGPDYAVLDPGLLAWRQRRTARRGTARVLIALGGGPHASLAAEIAEALVNADPDVQVRIAGGFIAGGRQQLRVMPRVCWVGRANGLGEELARADVAVVGGGVTLYEACALGTAAVAVPVVDAQRATIAGFVAKGAASGIVEGPVQASVVARMVLELVLDTARRSRLGRQGSRLVDGLGAMRAAAAVARLAQGRTRH